MKLYHYVPRNSNVMERGILSLSLQPQELQKYSKRVGSTDADTIIQWLEKTFSGRTRSISVLTEPVVWKNHNPMLHTWVAKKTLVEIDFDQLWTDGLIKSIWCKDGSDTVGKNEKLIQITPDEIQTTPLAWDKCNQEKGLFFAVIRHYLLVLKDGFIPQKYLKIIDK